MQQFELESVTECECSHVNIREENHGEDKVLAVDLALAGGDEGDGEGDTEDEDEDTPEKALERAVAGG